MARGYLGKISAVISANTGDYVRKLNESAKETRAFASTVQNTLGRASKDAAQSLNGIFTPLQKVERALRAAASQKLAFRGFDGAIRDVQSLQAAIAKLADQRTIDLVVKTSGVGSLEELKRTINVLRNQDVTVGVEGLRQQRASLGNTNNFVVSTAVRDEAARLDAVIEALDRIDAERIKKISIQVEDAQLTAATTQFRRLTELSTQIGTPLSKVQSEFAGLAGTIQAQFIPALAQTQTAYEQFQRRITDGADVAGAEFRGLVADVRVLEGAIGRLRETSAARGRLFTGEELTFADPQLVDQFARLATAQQSLASSPAGVRGSPIARDLLADAQILGEQIERIRARIERLNAQGLDIGFSQAGLDLAKRRLEDVIGLTERIAAGAPAGESAEIAAINRRAAAEADFIAESQRLREQAGADARAREEADAQRRLAAEADFIAESQRLREQAGADARAREEADAQRRLAAEADFIAESQRLREQALADVRAIEEAEARRMAEVASTFLQVDQQGSGIASNEGRSVPLAGNRDPRTRVLNTLNQDIGDLRNRTRGIGDTLAGDVGPIVDNLTTRFQNLARAGIGFTAEQARGLAREVANVNAALNSRQEIAQRFGESFGGAGRLGLSLGVDERSLRSIGSQIEFVQGRLSALAQEARGPVITALDALRTRAQQLFEGGALDTEEGRAELRALQAEIVRTLSAAGGGSEAQVRAGLQRAGDIGRGGFDRFSLAIQQAAFAIDDFFSVTGGLDQRIRAVGNNVSQLGFVLGGWQGLVAGIAASISAQLVVGLVKWYNAGVSSESQTKAINDALSQQKTLVDQLAQSFESLSDSLVQRAFSPATREAQSFAKSLREIAKQQKELQVARFTLLDPTAFQQNAQASEFQRRIQGTTDAGQTLALLRARARAEAAARAAAVGAAGRQGTFDDAVNAIGARPANRAEATNQIFGNIVDALGSIFTGPNPAASANRIRGTNTVEARQRFEAARGNRQEEIRVVEQRLNELQDLAQQGTDSLYGFFSGQSAASAAASREFARLTTVLATLNSQLESDNALISFLKRLNQATADIATAQEQAAEAIRAGIPGSFALASALDRLDSEIQASADAIKEAEKRLRDRGAAATVDDRQQRDDAVQRETARIARNRAARERVIARAAEVDRRRIVDPQSTLDAIRSRAEANLGESGLQSGSLARRLRELDARRREVEARLQREGGAANPFAARRADRELAAINQQAAAIEASTIALKKFTEYLNRAAQESQSNLEAARQREEQVRRDDLGRSTPRSRGARQRAEADLRRQEELNNRVQDEVAKARARLEEQAQDPANPLSGTFARAREIDQLLAAGGLSAAEQARLIEERRRLQDRIDRAINQEQSVIDARDASTREAERQQSEQRGRDLMLRPGQQAALELDRQIADIVEGAAGRRRRDPFGLNAARINQDEQDAIRRVREEAFRQQAPAIFGLADAVQNAILQGPSRAALQPTDVSTVEGSRELTRLLRGDDAARDQANLVELQKEANRLLDMIANNPANIAN